MRYTLTYLLFISIGSMGIILPIYDLISGGQRFILVNEQNIIIRYSFLLASLLISTALLLIPHLMQKFRIKGESSDSGKYSKAKFDFIVAMILLPGFIFAFVSFLVALANKALAVGFINFLLFIISRAFIKY